jgi:hypothetical protein
MIKVTTGEDDAAQHELQTWSYDAGANVWQRMLPSAEPESSGNRARNLAFAPEWNLAILENCPSKPREQQIWTYRYGPSDLSTLPSEPRLSARALVEDAVVSVTSATEVQLSWTPPVEVAPQGYFIERATVEVWSDHQLKRLQQRTPPLEEPVVGAIRRIGPFRRIHDQLLTEPHFVDRSIDLNKPAIVQLANDKETPSFDRPLHAEHLEESGRPYRRAVYAYRIRVRDEVGRDGGPSPAFFTIPSSPQNVFSREVGTTCELKWSANPERGIVGYRIYRMDGRYDKDPVSRLSQEPIPQTTFSDPNAGKQSRRYYIIAVDALGQEGFPSSPVWFQREWRDYYLPFTSDWHQ